jgi:5'(3')-deoxyribonucleotidase
MGERRFVLGVDLDGVCADFYGGLRPIAAEWLGRNLDELPADVTYGLPEWGVPDAPGGYDALHKFAVTQRELFKRLSPLPEAPQVLRRLSDRDVRIRIITHRLFIKYFHQTAVEQTIAWLDYWDIPYWDLCLLKDKTAVGADLYIEDSPDNIKALQDQGLKVIIYENPTNIDVEGTRARSWTEVEALVLGQLDEWKRGGV